MGSEVSLIFPCYTYPPPSSSMLLGSKTSVYSTLVDRYERPVGFHFQLIGLQLEGLGMTSPCMLVSISSLVGLD